MNRRISHQYTVLIARSGKPPYTLSFDLRMLLLVGVGVLSLPAIALFAFLSTTVQQNRHLVERNHQLTEQAQEILEQVEVLEGQIGKLQERAGIKNKESGQSRQPSDPQKKAEGRSQGGMGLALKPETLLELAENQIPELASDLSLDVQPALEKVLLREDARPKGSPLKVPAEISSNFGLRRNPMGKGYEFHEGMDFTAPYGSPIHVTAPGVVVKAGLSKGYGNHVVVEHGHGLRTLYAHLSKLVVTTGQKVERDRIVGFLGNTGRSTGPHLHYSVYHNQQPVDPASYVD